MSQAFPSPDISDHLLPPLVPVEKLCRPFSYAEVLSATNNFDYSLEIGRGGFGSVYKGVIDNGENVVAIKRWDSTSKQGESEFRTEIEMLSKFRHSNIVSLIGYCYSSHGMMLIYEYMNNGSLADHLFKQNGTQGGGGGSTNLSWVQRLEICLGAARGLDYLHTGTISIVEDGVIHRDVKSSNILLDRNWAAKVSDFGLSKTNPINQSYALTRARGTLGYIDPEYFMTGRLRKKSDVYSFGVVLLEVLCGRKVRDHCYMEMELSHLPVWASQCIEEGRLHELIDPNLSYEIFPTSLSKFTEIAYQCLCYDFRRRPTMTQVVASLELALELQLRKNDSSWSDIDIFADPVDTLDSTIVQQEVIKSWDSVKPTKSSAKPTKPSTLVKMLQQFCLWRTSMSQETKLATLLTGDSRLLDAIRQTRDEEMEIATIHKIIVDANINKSLSKEELMTTDNRFQKADIIFQHFDANQDNRLNAEELKALVLARNPGARFTQDQINALQVKLFESYLSFIDGEKGVTYSGFLQMYDDGLGDVHSDFATLGFQLQKKSQELLAAVENERSLRSRINVRHVYEHPEFNHESAYTDDSDYDERIMWNLRQRSSGVGPSQIHPSSPEEFQSSGYESSEADSPTYSTTSTTINDQELTPAVAPVVNMVTNDISFRETPVKPSQPATNNPQKPSSSDLLTFSESIKSRFSAASSRYKESISKSTRGLKEKLIARNSSVKELSKGVHREMSAGIAGVAKMIERLDLASKRTEAPPVPVSDREVQTSNSSLKGKSVQSSSDTSSHSSSHISNTVPGQQVEVSLVQNGK